MAVPTDGYAGTQLAPCAGVNWHGNGREDSRAIRTPDADNGDGPLSPRELRAADELIRRVRTVVPAQLVYAVLFGSKARWEARPDSDVDLLFIFSRLPRDREPHATIVEEIAEEVSAQSRFEVAPWSVSLVDLKCGMRTPMLVDALADGVPLWPPGESVPRPPFTPADALRCTGALLQRVEEGSAEAADLVQRGEVSQLAKRVRDDLVRLWTAMLLLEGETRPRRAAVARRVLQRGGTTRGGPRRDLLDWVIRSYGRSGRDDHCAVDPPPLPFGAVAREIDRLRALVARGREHLAVRIQEEESFSSR